MMVMCFLMSIPLKMMAFAEVKVVSHYLQPDNWSENSNFKFNTTDGKIYTCKLDNVPSGTQAIWFRIVKEGKEYGPGNGSSSDLVLTGTYQQIFEGTSNALKIVPTSGKTSYTITYNYETDQIKYDAPESGGTEGGGGTTTEKWETVTKNRLTEKKRVYTQGFYLAGNFFTFDTGGINYDDAVFKFQQQKDQSIAQIAETPYDVYMVEIPASLTAQAQVMYVDANGNKTGIFGPGTANKTIDKGTPATGLSTEWANITANESTKLLDNTQNYWNFSTRNESTSECSDGLYEVYIAVGKTSHEPEKWMITHKADMRVAYFISDAPDAIAMPLYDAYKKNTTQFGNKFFATVDLAANRSYYVISNYIYNNSTVDDAKDYGAFALQIGSPTTNKLFLQGNGGLDFTGGYPNNLICPNLAPLKVGKANWGIQIVEYNPSRGRTDKHGTPLGFCGDLQLRNDRKVLTSVSLVGNAIPGTTYADGTWNYKSNASDMVYDEIEQCYKARVVTTAEAYGKKFRFVGNRNPQITWYENTDGTEPKEMAKNPYDSKNPKVLGHTAEANDPNQVNYTDKGENSEEYWNIIWNRPAGRWTVRLYFYTYSDGNDPKTAYYYTITANMDMELHDVKDVVYGSSDNKQIITNLGDYKFMRTWSAQKAWKISNKVDIFVVSDIKDEGSVVKITLTNINDYVSKDERVIPPNTGVILATKSDASGIPRAQFKSRQNFTSYNNLVIPMEQYNTDKEYPKENNKLEKILVSDVIPSSDEKHYNYFFGYYNAQIATGGKANEYLLGFWISKGSKPYPSNSCYLPIDKETAAKMKYLGTSYDDFYTGGSAKKVPGVIFDFDIVGGTTGINEVVKQSTKLNNGKYYTLSGQQVEKPTAGGIYIHNGRKFVVK